MKKKAKSKKSNKTKQYKEASIFLKHLEESYSNLDLRREQIENQIDQLRSISADIEEAMCSIEAIIDSVEDQPNLLDL